jgi:hypothetical protein
VSSEGWQLAFEWLCGPALTMGARGRWAIDNHDVVVRFNLIRQQQLRNHTGTRATIRMLNHASATHLCKLGSEWHNATTQYSVAGIIKRLPEWAQYKWREYQNEKNETRVRLMHRTKWDKKLDLRGLVLWHEMSLKMDKKACLESWLGPVMSIEPFSDKLREDLEAQMKAFRTDIQTYFRSVRACCSSQSVETQGTVGSAVQSRSTGCLVDIHGVELGSAGDEKPN